MGTTSVLLVVFLLTCLYVEFLVSLRHCSRYEDTYGKWVPNPAHGPNKNDTALTELKTHFLGSVGPGEAIHEHFDKVWVPDGCAYHRFTNESIHKCVKHMLHKMNKTEEKDELHIMFIGDSATRGVLCGIARIIAGSEILGPCINLVCGGILDHATGYHEMFQQVDIVLFDGKLRFTFVYIKTFVGWFRTDWVIYDYIKNSTPPYAIIVNTGVWDFDDIARAHRGEDAPLYCHDNFTQEVAFQRAAAVNESFYDLAEAAQKHNVRLIYRNNHYNCRFGIHCADDGVDEILKTTKWERWDNHRITKDVWKEQTWDGFHFERIFIQRVIDHQLLVETGTYYNVYGKWMKWMHAGMLEMQLSQSMLQSLFYSCLQDKFGGGDDPSLSDQFRGEDRQQLDRARRRATRGRGRAKRRR